MGSEITHTAPVAVFFYGLFMDVALLERMGISPTRATAGFVDGYGLRIGQRATLVPAYGETAHGILMTLDGGEVTALYAQESVADYRATTVSVSLPDGSREAAACYLLPAEKLAGVNPEYAQALWALAGELGFPDRYLEHIRRQSNTSDPALPVTGT